MGIDLLIGLVFKFGPLFLVVGGLIAAYFHVKGKGIDQERAKWEAEMAEKSRQLRENMQKVEEADIVIDERVKQDVEKIKAVQDRPVDSDIFKF